MDKLPSDEAGKHHVVSETADDSYSASEDATVLDGESDITSKSVTSDPDDVEVTVVEKSMLSKNDH